jgi:hypothetical protein
VPVATLLQMGTESCPHCGESIPPPWAAHGQPGKKPMHSHTDCPKCRRPLIYFTEGLLAGSWRADDAAERERELQAEDA